VSPYLLEGRFAVEQPKPEWPLQEPRFEQTMDGMILRRPLRETIR